MDRAGVCQRLYEIMTTSDIIANLREEARSRGLTISEIARRSGIGRSRVSEILNGRRLNATFRTLARLADAIGIDIVTKSR